jgi:hypothetical protein
MAAARTPTVYRENMGSSTLLVARITTCVTGDTWVSGLKAIKYYWANCNATGGTQGSAGVDVSEASGTFTIMPGIDSGTVDLFVVCND